MSNEKYFHISDILSFYTGAIVGSHKQLTAPDGTVRPAIWGERLAPIIEIAGQVSGENLWRGEQGGDAYDGMRLAMMAAGVKEELGKQFPWLKDYPKLPKAPEGTDEQRTQFFETWVAGVAAAAGGEWFKVKTAAPATPAANNAARGPRVA